jgi:hypothetical protein
MRKGVFVTEDVTLRKMFGITDDEALDKIKKDIAKGSPALIYYPALIAVEDFLLASNGVQTDLLYSAARNRANNSSDVVFVNFFVEL